MRLLGNSVCVFCLPVVMNRVVMADRVPFPGRAPVAFGLRAIPKLFEQLEEEEEEEEGRKMKRRIRALNSLCDLMTDSQKVYQTINGGFLEQLKVLFKDKDPEIRTKTCQLIHQLTAHCIGRQAVLSSSLLPPLSQLLDDSSSSCRINVLQVLNRLTLLPAGADALLTLVPKLMLKLREEEEEEEEEEVLLLSTLSSCSRLNPLPAVAADGVSLLGRKLSHRSSNIRREAAAAMMALSVCDVGRQQVCEEEAVLPVLVALLQDEDVEVQANAAGVLMYAVIINAGRWRCLELDVIPILLDLVSKKKEEEGENEERRRRRKALVMNSLRVLTALAEAPDARRLLLQQLPLLEGRRTAAEEDKDIQTAAQTAIRVVTWTPSDAADL